MKYNFMIVLVLVKIIYVLIYCTADKIRFLKVERPNVTYVNPKYVGFLNQTVRRFNRKDPVYYYDLHFDTFVYMDNKVELDFYFYEWLTNAYKPTFVEMHFKWCNLIHKDMFFGAAMKQGNLTKPCPHPPGIYHLYNMTVPGAAIPGSFPFTKGRIYCNLTWNNSKVRDWAGALYVDMEIKTANRG